MGLCSSISGQKSTATLQQIHQYTSVGVEGFIPLNNSFLGVWQSEKYSVTEKCLATEAAVRPPKFCPSYCMHIIVDICTRMLFYFP